MIMLTQASPYVSIVTCRRKENEKLPYSEKKYVLPSEKESSLYRHVTGFMFPLFM